LLAGEPDDLLDATIEHGLERLTSNTLTTGDHLREAVATARAEGVAFDREETVLGLSCVSAPVIDADRRVTAALSVSIGVHRMVRIEALAPMVVAAARGISEQLGAPAHYPSLAALRR
jgi:DNA-binding IclR family transcriptional regulator